MVHRPHCTCGPMLDSMHSVLCCSMHLHQCKAKHYTQIYSFVDLSLRGKKTSKHTLKTKLGRFFFFVFIFFRWNKLINSNMNKDIKSPSKKADYDWEGCIKHIDADEWRGENVQKGWYWEREESQCRFHALYSSHGPVWIQNKGYVAQSLQMWIGLFSPFRPPISVAILINCSY